MVPVGGSEPSAPRRPELRFCRECNDLMKPKVGLRRASRCSTCRASGPSRTRRECKQPTAKALRASGRARNSSIILCVAAGMSTAQLTAAFLVLSSIVAFLSRAGGPGAHEAGGELPVRLPGGRGPCALVRVPQRGAPHQQGAHRHPAGAPSICAPAPTALLHGTPWAIAILKPACCRAVPDGASLSSADKFERASPCSNAWQCTSAERLCCAPLEQDVRADPTLPRTRDVRCPACSHNEAVFFSASTEEV